MEKKKILWLSRHEFTKEQFEALVKIYGEVDITQLNKTISTAEELKPQIEEFDVLAVVLPVELVADLMKITEKPIIFAVNDRILDETGEKVIFKFKCWKQYKKVEIEVEEL